MGPERTGSHPRAPGTALAAEVLLHLRAWHDRIALEESVTSAVSGVEVPDRSPLFAGLPDDLRAEMLAAAQPVKVEAGGWLFRQGDPGDVFYVVRTGRLELIVEAPPPALVVGLLGPGDVIGELALVTDAPRSASARAKRTSELLAVDRATFETLLRDNPAFARSLLQVVASKLRQTETLRPAARASVRVLCVASLTADIVATEVARVLARALGDGISTRIVETQGSERWHLIDQFEREVDLVLVPASGDAADLADCVNHADRVLVVARRGDPPRLDAVARLLGGCDLALVGRHGPVAPWLEALHCRAHHLLTTVDDGPAVGRLARRVTGRANGLVLSGGGARGFAHIGVVGELLGAGVEIDRVGGCSMGAFIGALVASGRPLDEIERVCRRELVELHPFRDYTLPRSSLIRGRRASAMLHRVFGGTCIEELACDYFAVSADLTTATLVVHRSGPIAVAVAASMAVPGLTPPVAIGGQLLVDGGVLDNLPVGVMADVGEGPVIGIDVMGRRLTTHRRPTLVEVLARATVLGSWRWVAANEARADATIRPELAGVGLLEFAKIETAIAAGRAAGRAALGSLQL